MGVKKFFSLPELPYGFKDLEPHLSEEQLRIHYEKHHSGYVNGANSILEKMDKARGANEEIDMKSTLKALSFNIGGHILHSVFWPTMSPSGGGEPGGVIGDKLDEEFGGFARFKHEFTQASASVEGSGWAALTFCKCTMRPFIMQIEKHNCNLYPRFNPILAVDVWEHAYYLDYQNDRGGFLEAFWNLVNWDEVEKRLQDLL